MHDTSTVGKCLGTSTVEFSKVKKEIPDYRVTFMDMSHFFICECSFTRFFALPWHHRESLQVSGTCNLFSPYQQIQMRVKYPAVSYTNLWFVNEGHFFRWQSWFILFRTRFIKCASTSYDVRFFN